MSVTFCNSKLRANKTRGALSKVASAGVDTLRLDTWTVVCPCLFGYAQMTLQTKTKTDKDKDIVLAALQTSNIKRAGQNSDSITVQDFLQKH